MKRTISIKLGVTKDQGQKLFELQEAYISACNQIVPFVIEHRCWNRVALHNLSYSKIRANSPLGSQMVCNAIFSVCKAYKNKLISKGEKIPLIQFRPSRSIHFDKRTYSLRGDSLSLYTLGKRIQVTLKPGSFQQEYLKMGVPKEAELVCKKGSWYFHLVLDLPDPIGTQNEDLLGVDLGENVLAATSNGKLFGGGQTRHERDQFLSRRRNLQSNGSQSAKQLLKKISGKEVRRMKYINHIVSKKIVQEAIQENVGTIVLEDLTNIRKRIQAKKRERTRLHRWAFRELRMMIEYKAMSRGLQIIYVNPAYSSKSCSRCDSLGVRQRHLFKCSCGNQQHSDLNASRNLCRFALSIGSATCAVNRTQVGMGNHLL
jgi:putative transposase